MGVAVDHQAAAVLAQHLVHRQRGHVHDGLGLVGVLLLALAAQLAGYLAAPGQGQAQEDPAQPPELGDAAKLLITQIPGAEQIAMAKQGAGAVEIDDAGVGQQGHAGAPGKVLAEQEVAVAVDEIEGHAPPAEGQEGIGHLLVQGIGVIVPNPELEQIAEHIEGIGPGGLLLQEVEQGGRHVGTGLTEVNVADKKGAHGALSLAEMGSRDEAERGGQGSRAKSVPSRASSA